MNSINTWTIGVLSLCLLSGCASKTDIARSPIPQDGPSMLDIYNGGTTDSSDATPRTDERVAKLCANLSERSERKRCLKKAQAANLLVDVADVTADVPIGEKDMAIRPDPLYDDYIRTSANEIDVLFPRLENPDIGIFIFPHLATSNRVPVPGYATVIPLYESVQYALPGEQGRIK